MLILGVRCVDRPILTENSGVRGAKDAFNIEGYFHVLLALVSESFEILKPLHEHRRLVVDANVDTTRGIVDVVPGLK